MTAHHPTDEQLALFVMRAHDAIDFDDLEGHLASCDHCVDRVAAEAELELSLQAIATATDWCPRCGVAAETTCMRCGIALRPGGYEVEAVLSEYGQGRTYAGRAPDGTRVRISELEFRHVRDHGVVESFVKEATLLAQLDHPNVPRLVDSFQEGDDEHLRLYAVESWVEGAPLDEVLDTHRFDESEARHIAEQVLDVLVYLQSLSPAIYHRDVRPQNLLWCEDGSVALRQFANARDMSVTGAFTLAGHTGYIPAEQHLGVVDATSDLYGLGATLAHLLTRRAPLPGDPGLERANVSDAFAAWLTRLLATEPRHRFASAAEARDALLAPPRPRSKPKLPWVLIATALAGSLALASGTIWVFREHSSSRLPKPPPKPRPPAPKGGKLILETTPPGAKITLNGKPVPWAETPADLSNLQFGDTYTIRVERAGYVPYETVVTMTPQLDGDIVHHTFVPLAPADDVAPPPTKASYAPPKPPKITAREPPRPRPEPEPEPEPETKTASSAEAPKRAPPGCVSADDGSTGYVTITTTPHSTLYWGKRRIGETPVARVMLPAGCVKVKAVEIGGTRTKTVQLKVEPNHVQIYKFELDP